MADSRDSQMFARLARAPSYFGRRWAESHENPGFRPPRPVDLGPELNAIRARIIASPDENGPRSEYADLLERRGDRARAEFIRLQLTTPTPDERQRELLSIHGEEWLRELGPWAVRDPVFRRGFIESVSVTGRVFLTLGEGLLAAAPIREVRLVAAEPFWGEILAKADDLRIAVTTGREQSR